MPTIDDPGTIRAGGEGRVAIDAMAAFRALDGQGVERPILLAFTPFDRVNPFQTLLYRRAWASGVGPVPVASWSGLDELVSVAAIAPLVVHLHWTNPVLRRAASSAESDKAVADTLADLDRLRAAGARIVWTVHNVLPHETRFEAPEVALRRGLVERADLVHVMAAATPDAVADRYPIPSAKVLHVPHPSYAGAYPDLVDRAGARYTLDLDEDAVVYALVGGIRPYKGLERLREAFETLHAEDPGRRRLVVAGNPSRAPETDAFLGWAAAHPAVLALPRSLPAADLALVLRAADVVVLPYERILNSGVLMLALTFGRPVVAPHGPGTDELVDPAFGVLFDPADPSGLADALRAADGLRTPGASAAALTAAARHDPDALSDRFMTAMRGFAESL